MRDILSGVLTLSDRGTAQHNHKTVWNTLTKTKSTSPSYRAHLVEVTPSRLHVSQVSSRDLQFPQTRTVSLQSSILQLLTLSPDRSTPRGPRDLSNPFVKDRHTFHQAFTNICTAPRSSQKAFIRFFATLFRQHSSGISLVYTMFSTRDIPLQMYPPDIQHTSEENSEHQGAPIFQDLVRQTLISVAHPIGLFARVPLEGPGADITRQVFLLSLRRIFANLPISLPTSSRQCHAECLCTATPSPKQTSAQRHLAAPSSPQGRTIWPQSS